MNGTTVKLIYLREVRDQCRDRRTLFMLLVLPILLYPALGFGLIQMTLRFGKEARRIGLVGVDQLSDLPPLLSSDQRHFAVDLFEDPDNQKLYQIEPGDWSVDQLRAKKVNAIIVFPDDFRQRLLDGEQASVSVLQNSTDDESQHAYRAAVEFIERWEKRIVDERLAAIGKTPEFANPIEIDEGQSDVASVQERSGSAWAKVFPFVLVIMALTGAFYPAVDLCAGEKERGTMETLLITPASRGEIVLAKFFTIMSLSVASTVLNLASMGLTLGQISSLLPTGSEQATRTFAPPSLDAIVWMFILMLPLAAFFSALCMALAVFARSTKEGQYYMMPMFVIVTPLVFLTLAPGVQLDLFYSLVPVTNVALLLRAFMLNQYELAMVFLLPVLIPTALYGFLALRFAVDQFHREDVLFREAEKFELRLWIRHLLRDKEPLPTSAQAWSLFVVMMLLTWYFRSFLAPSLISNAAFQLVVTGFVPIVFALLFTSRPAETLSLKVPRLLPTVLAFVLVFTLHPVVANLGEVAQEIFPLPEGLEAAFARLTAGLSLWQLLLLLAVVPAVCEEIAFRGFILRGMLQKHSTWTSILISSVLFGVVHMISAQVLIATLLGVVLGLILTRTGSLLPGMVFHVLHNGLMISREAIAEWMASRGIVVPDRIGFAVLVAGALASAILVGTLAALPNQVGKAARD